MLNLRKGLLGLALLTAASAFAAPSPAPEPARNRSSEVGNIDDDKVAPSQFIPVSERRLEDMRAMLKEAVQYVSQARETRDVIRLNCVNDKTLSMKGILRIAEDSFINLQEATASKDDNKARYEYSKIRVSWKKMRELRTFARGCVGAEATYSGGSQLDVYIEGDDGGTTMDYYGDQPYSDPASTWTGIPTGGNIGDIDDEYGRPQVASSSVGRQIN